MDGQNVLEAIIMTGRVVVMDRIQRTNRERVTRIKFQKRRENNEDKLKTC